MLTLLVVGVTICVTSIGDKTERSLLKKIAWDKFETECFFEYDAYADYFAAMKQVK